MKREEEEGRKGVRREIKGRRRITRHKEGRREQREGEGERDGGSED